MVFRTLSRLIGRQQEIDDLAQDVFLRLFRALPGFRNEALISTYLYRITVNVAQDEWKRHRRVAHTHVSLSDDTAAWEERLEHPAPTPEGNLTDREFQFLVEQHLKQLSGVERAVLVLYHQEERSYQQIADTLGLPMGTVRTHLHRGRRKLHDAIANQKGACS